MTINYKVDLISIQKAKKIIEKWHYSKSVNGINVHTCFGLFDKELIGAAVFGRPAMHNQWKKYVDKEEELLELRRLAIINDTPKNTESWFIGKMLRELKRTTKVKVILSYSDLNQQHEGTIYKASNFKYLGQTTKGRVIMWNNRKYHDKAIRTKYKGKLKPFAQRLKTALDNGEAYYVPQLPKNIYVYNLRK